MVHQPADQKISPAMARAFVILAVVGVSFSAIFVRLSSAASSTLAMVRMALSAVMFLIPALNQRKKQKTPIATRTLLMCMGAGVILGFHFLTYFEAVKNTSLASALVLVNTELIFVALACTALFHERIPPWGTAGVILAFIGGAIVTGGDFAFGPDALYGNAMAVLSAVCLCAFTLIGREARKTLSGTEYSFIVYACAALTLGLVMLAKGESLLAVTGTDLLCALGMAVCCTVLGHSVFIWALKYLPAPFISTTRLLEPVFTSILGFALFQEAPALWQILGGCIVLGGVALYTFKGADGS